MNSTTSFPNKKLRQDQKGLRLLAEWEEQDGVLLAWPDENTDWAPTLFEVEESYLEIVKTISSFERVLLVSRKIEYLKDKLQNAGINLDKIQIVSVPINDTWTRDFGPITVKTERGLKLLDFTFNAWGLKFAANEDNLVTRRIYRAGCFAKIPLQTESLVLEGGSIESDGSGILLTTEACLLQENRNPALSKEQIESTLKETLGVSKILWLKNGFLAGDDTNSHIDTLARLCPNNTIVYQSCDDQRDEHFTALGMMAQELSVFTDLQGSPFRLLALPWPEAVYDEEQRLPTTYANFLVINQAVLVPLYNQRDIDKKALAVISRVFPERQIIGINCLPLLSQHGSLHCVTMQLPKGVLK